MHSPVTAYARDNHKQSLHMVMHHLAADANMLLSKYKISTWPGKSGAATREATAADFFGNWEETTGCDDGPSGLCLWLLCSGLAAGT